MQHEKIQQLLDYLKPLSLDDFDQSHGQLYLHNGSSDYQAPGRKACVACHAYIALGGTPYTDSILGDHYDFMGGIRLLCDAFDMSRSRLEKLLEDCGAGDIYPFSCEPWKTNPYDVFRQAYDKAKKA